MDDDAELIALIDLIYSAALDDKLWPTALAKLADVVGTMQAIIATMDRRADTFDSISRRTYPELDASYKSYWAFHNPLWINSATQPVGKVYSFDTLMERRDFAKTPIFNEWWKQADYGFAMLGANLLSENNVSAVICMINDPKHETPTPRQTRLFEAALRHIVRAIRIHRQLWTFDLGHETAPERFENLRHGAILVDAAGHALYANAAARTLLDAGDGLVIKNGCVASKDGSVRLQQLIASCAPGIGPLHGPLGGEFEVRRSPNRTSLNVVVTPLRSKAPVMEIPWLGLRPPVAIVTVVDPEIDRRTLTQGLHRRFGLTTAEARLAAEIVKGDGREAAARRRGVSVATARAQLSSIFEKTGTRRQAELVHLLLDVADKGATERWDL